MSQAEQITKNILDQIEILVDASDDQIRGMVAQAVKPLNASNRKAVLKGINKALGTSFTPGNIQSDADFSDFDKKDQVANNGQWEPDAAPAANVIPLRPEEPAKKSIQEMQRELYTFVMDKVSEAIAILKEAVPGQEDCWYTVMVEDFQLDLQSWYECATAHLVEKYDVEDYVQLPFPAELEPDHVVDNIQRAHAGALVGQPYTATNNIQQSELHSEVNAMTNTNNAQLSQEEVAAVAAATTALNPAAAAETQAFFAQLTPAQQEELIEIAVKTGAQSIGANDMSEEQRNLAANAIRAALKGDADLEVPAVEIAKVSADGESFLDKHFSLNRKGGEGIRSGWVGAGVATLVVGAEVLLNGRTSTGELLGGAVAIASSYCMGEVVDSFLKGNVERYAAAGALGFFTAQGAMHLGNVLGNPKVEDEAAAAPTTTVVLVQPAPASVGLPVYNNDSPIAGL